MDVLAGDTDSRAIGTSGTIFTTAVTAVLVFAPESWTISCVVNEPADAYRGS